MIRVASLSYSVEERVILNNLSFHLPKDDNLTILGANGAGKSTLAQLLCGLLKSKNTIYIDGKEISHIPHQERAKYINLVPSKFSLYDPYIDVKSYLELSLYKEALQPTKRREVLSLLGLSCYHDSYASKLSSGEQQLLQLASSLMQSAQITILDEPTSNLDPQKTKIVFDILRTNPNLKQKILITHDLNLAYQLGYPILYLDNATSHYYHDDFFTPDILQHYFGDTIKIVDGFIVEVL